MLLCATGSTAQSTNPEVRFAHPMKIPIDLSGNFMELRSDHFHSGLDMRTGGQEGQPVMAAAEGWVSRIKISPWGYGKAVYIDHPNGYTTVYAHLRDLVGNVGETALASQYREKCFDIDQYVEKGRVPVVAGQVIGHSGNSGSSGGPHLHFEVRRSSDQHALDPEAYGMSVPDRVPPTLQGLRIDALGPEARVAPYPGGAVGFPLVARNDSTFTLKEGARPSAYGTVGIAVNVTDRYDSRSAKCGIRKLEVWLDGTPVFSALLDHVDFEVNRYANAYMDYRLFKDNRMDYNRCYRLPNNKLGIYGKEAAQGRLQLVPGKEHEVRVVATDANGNRSTLTFKLSGADAVAASAWAPAPPTGTLFPHDRANTLEQEGLRFKLPAGALYQDEHIRWSAGKDLAPNGFAPWHALHDPYTPLQANGEVALRLDAPVPNGLEAKLVMVRKDHSGKTASIGGSVANGWITAKTRTFGRFTVMMDTIPPKISAVDLKPVMTGRRSFTLRVDDDLSGLDTYSGQLDGKWVLLEYDPKTKSLTHHFDVHSEGSGPRELVVEVGDERKNRSRFSYAFMR